MGKIMSTWFLNDPQARMFDKEREGKKGEQLAFLSAKCSQTQQLFLGFEFEFLWVLVH